jgi:hypothetical protein
MSYLTSTYIENAGRYGTKVLFGSIAILALVVLLSSVLHNKYHYTKKTLYTLICGVSLGAFLALLVVLLSLTTSSSRYEVRSASIDIGICGQQITDTSNRSFLDSAPGTSRHIFMGDGRLEFRGFTNKNTDDATLGKFFESIGGSITTNSVAYPVGEGMSLGNIPEGFIKQSPSYEKLVFVNARDNDKCSVIASKLAVYVYQYRTADDKYALKRVKNNIPSYQISKSSYTKRDCVIVYFGDELAQSTTEKIGTCNGYPGKDKIAPGKVEDI